MPEPFLNLSSGYIQRAQSIIPKQGQIAPWRLDQDYDIDKKRLATASLDDIGLKIN
jgi:hypothetical protein